MKRIKKCIKSENGSVTTIVVASVLFFIIILSTAYMITVALRKSQLRSQILAKETYEKDLNNVNDILTSLKTEVIDGVKIPEGFAYVGGTIDSGLVISDNQEDKNKYKGENIVGTDLKGNQYVWIEVPKAGTVYKTATLDIVSGENGKFTEAEYVAIERDLQEYTETYRNGTSYRDEYDDLVVQAGTGLTNKQYVDLKNTMLQSVYENGGFWIGRYEAGVTNNRTSHISTTEVPTSKINQFPYTYVYCSEAQSLASRVNSGSCTSSLMFGIQWDLVLKYLETTGATQESLNGTATGSTNWGNYRDSAFRLNRGKYAKYTNSVLNSAWNDSTVNSAGYVEEREKKVQNSDKNSVLLTTGASDKNVKQNIYDLAGNVSEWTLEYTFNSTYSCADRGGDYTQGGAESKVSKRNSHQSNYSNHNMGFRVTLY